MPRTASTVLRGDEDPAHPHVEGPIHLVFGYALLEEPEYRLGLYRIVNLEAEMLIRWS